MLFGLFVWTLLFCPFSLADEPTKEMETEIPCWFTDPATGSHFDLRPLRMPSASSYRVKDNRDISENYTYIFNVCGDVDPPIEDCKSTRDGEGKAPAFQITGNRCHRLGHGKDFLGEFKSISLIDKDDPTLGISLNYTGGDRCHSNNVSRSLTIDFYCADQYGEIPESTIGEPKVCAYSTAFETIFGCPIECPFSNRMLCGENGFCGMDVDAKRPRCFCNKGFYGDDCTATAPITVSACNKTCVSLIIVILLLTALLVSAFIIFLKVRRLSRLNLRFGELSNSFNNDSVSLGTFTN